jgi:hypothetical protein
LLQEEIWSCLFHLLVAVAFWDLHHSSVILLHLLCVSVPKHPQLLSRRSLMIGFMTHFDNQ